MISPGKQVVHQEKVKFVITGFPSYELNTLGGVCDALRLGIDQRWPKQFPNEVCNDTTHQALQATATTHHFETRRSKVSRVTVVGHFLKVGVGSQCHQHEFWHRWGYFFIIQHRCQAAKMIFPQPLCDIASTAASTEAPVSQSAPGKPHCDPI